MTQCNACKWEYPDGYTAPLLTTEGSMAEICGICALEISNKLHGINRKKFDGQRAEEMRQDAIAYRKGKQ